MIYEIVLETPSERISFSIADSDLHQSIAHIVELFELINHSSRALRVTIGIGGYDGYGIRIGAKPATESTTVSSSDSL